MEETVRKYEDISKRLKTSITDLEQARVGREENKERDRLLDEMMDLQLERDELVKKCQDYEKNDPKVIQKIKLQLEVSGLGFVGYFERNLILYLRMLSKLLIGGPIMYFLLSPGVKISLGMKNLH